MLRWAAKYADELLSGPMEMSDDPCPRFNDYLTFLDAKDRSLFCFQSFWGFQGFEILGGV